jgi:pimeloyl-ACP methyl ester carboxylesterase
MRGSKMRVIMQVHFKTSSGKRLSGELMKECSDQLVVVCHGYKSSGSTPTISALTKGLNQRGYSTFAFDFPKDSEVDVRQQVSDIANILRHFPEYKGFVLLAASYGALSASIAAMKLPKVGGLITVNGFFGTSRLGKQHLRAYIMFRLASLAIPRYRNIWRYYRKELHPESLSVPVLVIHSKIDQVVFFEQSQHFYEKVKGRRNLKYWKVQRMVSRRLRILLSSFR